MLRKEVGVYHTYLCKKIMEKRSNVESDVNGLIIKREEFRKILGWFNIPIYIQCKFIDEMKRMGLVKIRDKQNIVLIKRKVEDDWFG